MKRLTALFLLCALTGCAQKNNLPAVSGSAEPINTPQIIKEFGNV
jgi:predicted small lipoprotein YifL